MSAKLVIHLPPHERELLDAGNISSFYLRIKNLVQERGGTVELESQFPPSEPDGNLHIVDNARKSRPDVLIAATAYLEGCWHLDPKGVLADSSIGDLNFDPNAIDPEVARVYVDDLKARFSTLRKSRYFQKTIVEEIDPGAIVVFLQGPPPYRRGQAYMSRDEMLRSVLAGAGDRPVYIKPHPIRKEEGIEIIKELQDEGFDAIKTNANVHDLLAQAAVTVSANSAAAIEGFFHGTPALLFARSDFAVAAETVTLPSEFTPALERAVNGKKDYTKFLYWYFSQCLWLEAEDFEEKVLDRFALMGFDAARLGLSM